jgi:hypothetical protein
VTGPPGLRLTSPRSSQPQQTRTRGGRSLRRDVILQCGGCGAKVTARVNGRRLVFHSLAGVTTTWAIAQEHWLNSEGRSTLAESNRLRREYLSLRDKPTRFIHRHCGGGIATFDLKGIEHRTALQGCQP